MVAETTQLRNFAVTPAHAHTLCLDCVRRPCAQVDEVRGDRVPRLAGAEHAAPEHHLEPPGNDEQLLVPLQGAPCDDMSSVLHLVLNNTVSVLVLARKQLFHAVQANYEPRDGCGRFKTRSK